MGYRRDGKQEKEWLDWLALCRDELVACGVAEWIYSDQLRWHYFVGHGYDGESGWSPNLLPLLQRHRLFAFILREYGEDGLRHFGPEAMSWHWNSGDRTSC
jgi:hypothetical protein